MSTSDYILFHTELPPADASERLLAALPLGRSIDAENRIFLVRDNPSPELRQIGGQLSDSVFRALLEVQEGEESVMDGYTLDWDLGVIPRLGEEVLHAASRALFREVAAAVVWPSVLVLDGQWLMAASRPETGLVEFDPPVSPDGDNRGQWAAFDVAER